jgi:DNA invertase Pin-like site-specific DNA recombinase
MTNLTDEQEATLAQLRRAAARKEQAEARLYALAAEAVVSVPAVHVARAARISRATLYRAFAEHAKEKDR